MYGGNTIKIEILSSIYLQSTVLSIGLAIGHTQNSCIVQYYPNKNQASLILTLEKYALKDTAITCDWHKISRFMAEEFIFRPLSTKLAFCLVRCFPYH